MLIRKAQKNDFEQIDRMYHSLHTLHVKNRPDIFNEEDCPFSLKWYKNFLKDENSIILVCEENEKICGFCFGKIVKRATPTLKTTADLDDIFVAEEFRKRGIATALYEEFEKLAKQSGAYQTRLWLWSFNKEAEAFYRKMGMSEQRIVMEKNI